MNQFLKRLQSLPTAVREVPRNVKLFLMTVLAFGSTVEGIGAVLLNLYLLRLGYGTEFVGTVNSAGLFVFALVSLPLGSIKWVSSRQMLQFGQVMSLIGLVGLPLAQYVPSAQAPLLIGFRIVAMIGLSAYFVHQIPFVLDMTEPKWHSRVMAWTMATFSLAAFVGSWVGGVLPEVIGRWLDVPMSDPRPFQLPMFLAAVVLIPAIIALYLIPEEADLGFAEAEEARKAGRQEGESRFGDWRAIIGLVLLILLIRALQTGGVGVMLTYSNVYLDDALLVPTGRVGLISGLGRLAAVPVSLMLPWLMARYSNFRLVIVSLASIVALMIPIALLPYWQVAAVGVIAVNSMSSLRYLAFVSFTMSLVSEKQRSLISGAGEMAIGVGFATSSFIGGYLIAWYGYRELFLFGAAMTTIGTVLFWILFRGRAQALKSGVAVGRPAVD